MINKPNNITRWIIAMRSGALTGRPFSERTIEDYQSYVEKFIQRYKRVSIETLKHALSRIEPNKFATREKLYKSIMSFARFLVKGKLLRTFFLIKAKALKPKRHWPIVRHSIDEKQLKKLIEGSQTIQEKLIVVLLSSTGLRASEACSLKWEHIDLESGKLTVERGKGNKTRSLGIASHTIKLLTKRKADSTSPYVFVNSSNQPATRHSLGSHLRRIGERAGVKVSPHALRRAFVTIHANYGVPIPMLQIACGHSNIETTMKYCRTTELEVIKAMKDWNIINTSKEST